MIEMAKKLTDYLGQEKQIGDESAKRWEEELQAASNLALLNDRLTVLVRITSPLILTLADLFVIAQSQLFGAISLLLRRRRSDAEVLTPRAIEAAAMTNRLFAALTYMKPIFRLMTASNHGRISSSGSRRVHTKHRFPLACCSASRKSFGTPCDWIMTC